MNSERQPEPYGHVEIGANLEKHLQNQTTIWLREIRHIFPEVHEDIEVRFDNSILIPEWQVGGRAESPDLISLAFYPRLLGIGGEQSPAFVERLGRLKGATYHEAMHIVQQWTMAQDKLTPAVEEAIYEGVAIKFEQTWAGTRPPYGDYEGWEDIRDLAEQIRDMKGAYDVGKWKFHDPESDRRWIIYRAGTYIVDQALKNDPGTDVVQMARMAPSEILKKSGLDY